MPEHQRGKRFLLGRVAAHPYLHQPQHKTPARARERLTGARVRKPDFRKRLPPKALLIDALQIAYPTPAARAIRSLHQNGIIVIISHLLLLMLLFHVKLQNEQIIGWRH